MVNPHVIRVIEGDRITSPHVLRVQILISSVISRRNFDTRHTVMWMFWMITLLLPPVRRRPLPLRTPSLPTPTMLLLEPTRIGDLAALSYVHEIQVPSSQVSWIHACPADVPPSQVVVRVLQH